jgi:thioredoxin reductase
MSGTGDRDWDLAVVGAGIAGLTAARTAASRGLRVCAWDALSPGGRLVNIGDVVGYPGVKTTGPDLMSALLEEAMGAGVEIAYGEVTGVSPGFTLATAEGDATARAVVVATGLTDGVLDVPGDWTGRGVATCATCDGPLYAGKPVVVVGDDEWAAHEARELTAFASRVTIVAPGEPRWSAAPDGIEVRSGTVTGVLGEDRVAGLALADGTELEAGGVFVYTGARPRSELISDGPGLFAAGDVAGTAPYLVAAAADGLRAGLAAVEFLEES